MFSSSSTMKSIARKSCFMKVLFVVISLSFRLPLFLCNSTEYEDTSLLNSTEHEKILLQTFAAKNEKDSGCYLEEGCLDRDNIDLDKDIGKVCERLRSLDVTLTKLSEDPPVNGGEEMMKLLRIYNQACLDLLYLSSMDKLKVLNAAEDILEKVGPRFFDIDVDEKVLEERFQWDEDKMDEFSSVRKKTYEHWNDLWYIFNNFP